MSAISAARWRRANPEKARANNVRWNKAHPGYHDSWWKAHPEKLRLKRARSYAKNKKEISLKRARWRQENPDAERLRYRSKIARNLARTARWRKDNPEKVLRSNAENNTRYNEQLHDIYICGLIKRQTNLSTKEISPAAIRLKRSILKIKRQVRAQSVTVQVEKE